MKEREEIILNTAKLNYPQGTVFKYPIPEYNHETSVVINDNFFIGDTGNIYCSERWDSESVKGYDGCVYYNGVWAEIISKPKIQEQPEVIKITGNARITPSSEPAQKLGFWNTSPEPELIPLSEAFRWASGEGWKWCAYDLEWQKRHEIYDDEYTCVNDERILELYTEFKNQKENKL